MSKHVLIVGSGGREHALAWKLAQSPRTGRLYVAPGNGGTREIAENIPIEATNIASLAHFAETHAIDLTVVGPDDPLALGIVDVFQARGMRIFGPTRAAAEIEASKAFAKQLMAESGIPSAVFRVFRSYDEACAYVREHSVPIVIKASGLALGKGVYVCRTLEEADEALRKIMLERVHGSAGNEVIIEEFLEGREVSIHALSDGNTFKCFPSAQDHKPIREGGENTGGMGTIAPVPWLQQKTLDFAKHCVIQPTLDALRERGQPFKGLLYPGLKITPEGPRVLEFNARFGDPETQSYMRLLDTDLLDLLESCTDGTLATQTIAWRPGFAACVVLASDGYPGPCRKDVPIHGITEADRVSGIVVFHAGTRYDNGLRTAGGRVLGVTAVGETLPEALERVYEGVRIVHFKGMQYRNDIGAKALQSPP